jgi:hypothetical protein
MKTHIEELEREVVNGKPVRGIWALFNMIGGVAGLLSILTVAVFGGELKRQVQVDTRRIDVLESQGSPSALVLAKSLQSEIEIRREGDIANNKRIEDARADLSQRIGNITVLLEKLVEQQTRLITLIQVQQQIQSK